MVDPIGEAERARFYRRLKLGVAVLVGGSAGLTTAQAQTTPVETAGAVAAGLVVGYLLAWVIVPADPDPRTNQRRRQSRTENPFADGGSDSGSSDDADSGADDRPGDGFR